MDPFAQAHLSELLAAARMEPTIPPPDPEERRARTLMTYNAALEALKGVGAISQEEMADWNNRMRVVLGEKPFEPLPPGTARLVNFGGKRAQQPERPPDPPPVSRFICLVPAELPDRPLPYGGRIQILGVELYSHSVSVNWRLAPLPDPEVLFAEELAQQEPDLEDLSDDFKKILRDKLVERLQMQRRSLSLSDDIGTQYLFRSGGGGGGHNERRGHQEFAPGVPPQAHRLVVHWDEMDFEVALPRNREPS